MLLRKSLYLGKKSLSSHRTFSWSIKWLERIPYKWPTTEMSLFLARNFGMQWHEWYLLLYLVELDLGPGNTWSPTWEWGQHLPVQHRGVSQSHRKHRSWIPNWISKSEGERHINIIRKLCGWYALNPSSEVSILMYCQMIRWSWHRTPPKWNVWWYSSPTLHRFADDYACISKILDGPDSSICWRNTSNRESDCIAHHCISTTLL